MAARRNLNPSAIPDLSQLLAELSELACRQLEKLGMSVGFLQKQHPFLMSSDAAAAAAVAVTGSSGTGSVGMPGTGDPDESGTSAGDDTLASVAAEVETVSPEMVTNREDLQLALESEKAFDELYLVILNQTYEAWKMSQRPRSASKIRGTIAALEQARNRPATSEEIYTTLSTRYAENGWKLIEAQLLRQCTALQERLGRSRERLLSTLALVRTGMAPSALSTSKWTLGGAMGRNEGEVAKGLMKDVKELSRLLDKGAYIRLSIQTPERTINQTGDVPEIS